MILYLVTFAFHEPCERLPADPALISVHGRGVRIPGSSLFRGSPKTLRVDLDPEPDGARRNTAVDEEVEKPEKFGLDQDI